MGIANQVNGPVVANRVLWHSFFRRSGRRQHHGYAASLVYRSQPARVIADWRREPADDQRHNAHHRRRDVASHEIPPCTAVRGRAIAALRSVRSMWQAAISWAIPTWTIDCHPERMSMADIRCTIPRQSNCLAQFDRHGRLPGEQRIQRLAALS